MSQSYIESIDSKRHLMLVHDDIKKAREVEFHFLRLGLEKGERVFYLTHDDPKLIEREMEKHGINLQHYKKNGMLYVYQIPNLMEHPKGVLKGAEDLIQKITFEPKVPFRIVGRLIPDVGFELAISVQYYIEKTFHAIFDSLNGSVMCTYDFSQIQANDRWQTWLSKLETCHHASIFYICEKVQIKSNTP